MIDQLMTNKASELLSEVLGAERRRLLPEIRHTDTRRMRTELQTRLRTIDRLIERFGQKRAESAGGVPE
jgi:hypothetical protein